MININLPALTKSNSCSDPT